MFNTGTMYCFRTSNIVYNLHFLNGTCNSSDTIFRHQTVPLTLHIVLALLCLLLSLITHLRYNSICVLNVTLRSSIISNGLWMIYFTILSLRSVVGAVMYVRDPSCKNPAASHQLTACLIIADAALRPLEVLCLCRALQHQFLFRSQGILQQEILLYNSQEDSFSGTEPGSSMSEAAVRTDKNDSGALLLAQFILAVVFIILLLALTQDVTVGIYWIYLCLYWIQCITSVVLAILIATNKNEDGPTFLVKLSFLVGVFFSLPGDVPSFIWSCISYSHASTGYCFALAFSFLSVLFLFIALRAEFLRLKQEAQYHAIEGEVESLFSVHSETITAS